MPGDDLRLDTIAIHVQLFARCSQCGAFIIPAKTSQQSINNGEFYEPDLCDACFLGQSGADEVA
jgi:hypothetical protein